MSVRQSFASHRRTNTHDGSTLHRPLRMEALEDRRMLATMVVTNLDDGSLANLAGDGQLSLREAVEAINIGAPVDGISPTSGSFGVNDVITFQDSLFSSGQQTLPLTAGQIELAKKVSLLGPGSDLLTIDAEQNSRLLHLTAGNETYVISQLTLTSGMTTGLNQGGGAILSMSSGQLSVLDSVLTENAVAGSFSVGGAISAMGNVVLEGTTISNNRTEGSGGGGGGIFALGNVTLTNSTIADNQTEGSFASGAGISSNGLVTINNSTVSGNHVLGAGSAAGGISGISGVVIFQSTVSGNQTTDATGNGGGVSSLGPVDISYSTIVNNQTLGANATGAGVWTAESDITVFNSIIADNTAGGGNDDIQPGSGTLDVSFSLIGNATGLGLSAANNLLNMTPLLGPLAGGRRTQTHAPLPSSPVINAGAEIIVLPPINDQRGAPFSRIADGTGNSQAIIDMGAHEVQSPASADFDNDGDVDGSDFLTWQRGYGSNQATSTDGNTDEDTDVDNQDLAVWSLQYGQQTVLTNVARQSASVSSDVASLEDLAIAVELVTGEATENASAILTKPEFLSSTESHQQAFATLAPSTQAAAVEAIAVAQTESSSTNEFETLSDELIVTTF